MIKVLFPSILLFSFFYFTLRYLKLSWEKRKLPAWSRFLLGIFAWGALASFVGILVGLAMPIVGLFTAPAMGTAFVLGGEALGIGAIAKYANANPELFDFPSMKPFLKDSLAFVDPSRRWDNIFEELEKHEVRRVYKEVTGNDLPDDDEKYDRELKQKLEATKSTAFSRDTRVAAPKGTMDVLAQAIASPHLKSELERLRQGAAVDITDSWRINRLKRSSHDYFKLVAKVIADPMNTILDLHLQSELFTAERVRDPVLLYRLKQDVYDFLQAVHQCEWVQPYLHEIEMLTCTCAHYEDEAFVGPRVHPVCRFRISRAELKAREGTFFNAGEMKTEVLV